MAAVRFGLDWLYRLSGVAAALCLVAILLLIVAQMVARWTGEIFPGAPQYAGYMMAAASFLAFANALNGGAHIRVSILLNAVPGPAKRLLEIWCFGIATAVAAYFVYYAATFVYWSWRFNEVAGQTLALWIPNNRLMVIRGGILFIAIRCDTSSRADQGPSTDGSNVVERRASESVCGRVDAILCFVRSLSCSWHRVLGRHRA
jgi:TRAP-type C4-dicarboxylate transport system permease small subunit